MRLLRPYPDELVGSLLHRATRQFGLSQKRLLPLLTGRSLTSHSMVLTTHVGIAAACGMDLSEFLRCHTLLPYTTAFMPQKERKRIEEAFTKWQQKEMCAAAIAQNSTKSTSRLKLCAACIHEDLFSYGESYWHRAHQLPSVELCLRHAYRLLSSDIEIRHPGTIPPPHELDSFQSLGKNQLPFEVQLKISQISLAALNGALSDRKDWTAFYQSRAQSLSYAFNGGHIYGEVLTRDLLNYYSSSYLATVECPIDLDKRDNWPGRMVRCSAPNSTALKHVLLNVFLASSPTPSKPPTEFEHRKKSRLRDWRGIELDAISRMEKLVSQHKAAGTRVMLKELFEVAEIGVVMKHHRHQVPRLVAWIEAFKASPQADRQAGKRPRKYAKKSRFIPSQ